MTEKLITIELKDGKIFYTDESSLQKLADKVGTDSTFITVNITDSIIGCTRYYPIILNKNEIKIIF